METVQSPGILAVLLNFFGYYIPFILLAVWAPLALIDLARREDINAKTGTIWAVAVIGLPFFGAGAYHLFGKSNLPAWVRNVLVFGGLGMLVVFFLIGSLIN